MKKIILLFVLLVFPVTSCWAKVVDYGWLTADPGSSKVTTNASKSFVKFEAGKKSSITFLIADKFSSKFDLQKYIKNNVPGKDPDIGYYPFTLGLKRDQFDFIWRRREIEFDRYGGCIGRIDACYLIFELPNKQVGLLVYECYDINTDLYSWQHEPGVKQLNEVGDSIIMKSQFEEKYASKVYIEPKTWSLEKLSQQELLIRNNRHSWSIDKLNLEESKLKKMFLPEKTIYKLSGYVYDITPNSFWLTPRKNRFWGQGQYVTCISRMLFYNANHRIFYPTRQNFIKEKNGKIWEISEKSIQKSANRVTSLIPGQYITVLLYNTNVTNTESILLHIY